jgi:hypothetical protein
VPGGGQRILIPEAVLTRPWGGIDSSMGNRVDNFGVMASDEQLVTAGDGNPDGDDTESSPESEEEALARFGDRPLSARRFFANPAGA